MPSNGDALKLDELSWEIIGELSKPRTETIDSLSRALDKKPAHIRQSLENLVTKKYVKKGRSDEGHDFYELLNSIINKGDKLDDGELEILDFLATPNILSASQITHRNNILNTIGELKVARAKVPIQLVIKRLELLMSIGAIRTVAVPDKRVKFKYMLSTEPTCVTTPSGRVSILPVEYKRNGITMRRLMITGCPYKSDCDYCTKPKDQRNGKVDCQLYKDISQRISPPIKK